MCEMKSKRILLGIWLALASIVSAGGYPPGKYSASVGHLERPGFERAFIIGGADAKPYDGAAVYRTFEALEKAIAELPKGSTLEWWPSCVRIAPNASFSEGEIERLRETCRKTGITLIVHPSG